MSRLRCLVLALPVCVLGLLASTASAQTPAPTARAGMPQDSIEAAVRALHARMQQAAEHLDADALYAYVLDTGTPPIIEDGVVYNDRATALATTSAGLRRLNGIAYHYTRQHVTVLSPSLALWIGEGTATATRADGSEIGAPFAETIVLQLEGGQWKVRHAHRSAPNVR